jgi:opacity protein-like surface antigen
MLEGLMRLLVTVASAFAIAGPALAADVYVPVAEQFPEAYFEGNKAAGYIGVHYGFAWLNYAEDRENISRPTEVNLFGVAGRGNLPFAPNSMFNLQIDGTADTVFTSGRSFGTPIEATGHLYYRDPQRFSAGAFGTYGVAEGNNIWGGGLEGQYFFDRVTAYAQGGYRTIDAGVGNNEWYVRGIGRWFPTDNLRLEGEIGYAWLSIEDNPTDRTLNTLFWTATAEYRFDHMPLGVFAQYRGASYYHDQAPALFPNAYNAAVFGVRAHLGSDNLIDNDRRGASYDTRPLDFLDLELLSRSGGGGGGNS